MQHLISSIAGFLADRRMGPVTHWAIKQYINHYNVSLDDALISDIKQYKRFNDFFTRHLKVGARPVADSPSVLSSPADGTIVQAGPLSNRQWHVKGYAYDLAELLTTTELCDRYRDGYSVNIYLSPRDYHRVHMPYDGILKQCIYVKGALYSVNPNHPDAKFINKNERLICEFENEHIGRFIVMFIGAFNVGSINTAWQDYSKENHSIEPDTIRLKKGAEVGYFKLGSSILLMTEKATHPTDQTIVDHCVRMGEQLLSLESNT